MQTKWVFVLSENEYKKFRKVLQLYETTRNPIYSVSRINYTAIS